MRETKDGMTHKRTGRDVFDALLEQVQDLAREDKAGEVCSDALAPRPNKTAVDSSNHDEVARAITGED